MQYLNIKNRSTGEVIEFDNDMAKHLICATLAYATVVIDGCLTIANPEDALLAIIKTATANYIDEH